MVSLGVRSDLQSPWHHGIQCCIMYPTCGEKNGGSKPLRLGVEGGFVKSPSTAATGSLADGNHQYRLMLSDMGFENFALD